VLEDRCLPSTLYVTSPLDDGSKGTLRYDIAHAQSGDTIVMSPSLTAPIVLTQGELLLKKNLTIEGQANQPETISGNHNSRVFEVAAKVSVTLTGLDITGGNGVANPSGSSGNDGHGGGVLNFGTLTVNNSTLSGNSVSHQDGEGGAIYNAGTLTVSNSTLSGNSAYGAGGVADGGGIANNGGTVTVSNSTLSGNSAAYAGGAIFNYVGGTVTVSSTTLSGNSASYAGGGIFNYAGTVRVSNSTLSDDSAGFAGAIYNNGDALMLSVSNSVFSGNSPDNIHGAYTDGGGNTGLT
jgi:hypothetical protein